MPRKSHQNMLQIKNNLFLFFLFFFTFLFLKLKLFFLHLFFNFVVFCGSIYFLRFSHCANILSLSLKYWIFFLQWDTFHSGSCRVIYGVISLKWYMRDDLWLDDLFFFASCNIFSMLCTMYKVCAHSHIPTLYLCWSTLVFFFLFSFYFIYCFLLFVLFFLFCTVCYLCVLVCFFCFTFYAISYAFCLHEIKIDVSYSNIFCVC